MAVFVGWTPGGPWGPFRAILGRLGGSWGVLLPSCMAPNRCCQRGVPWHWPPAQHPGRLGCRPPQRQPVRQGPPLPTATAHDPRMVRAYSLGAPLLRDLGLLLGGSWVALVESQAPAGTQPGVYLGRSHSLKIQQQCALKFFGCRPQCSSKRSRAGLWGVV